MAPTRQTAIDILWIHQPSFSKNEPNITPSICPEAMNSYSADGSQPSEVRFGLCEATFGVRIVRTISLWSGPEAAGVCVNCKPSKFAKFAFFFCYMLAYACYLSQFLPCSRCHFRPLSYFRCCGEVCWDELCLAWRGNAESNEKSHQEEWASLGVLWRNTGTGH